MIKKIKCLHKWIPNGMKKRNLYHNTTMYGYIKYGEEMVISAICQNCGKTKIDIVRDK